MNYNKSLYADAPNKNVNLSRFNLSYEWKGQLRHATIFPIAVWETMPMDEWDIDSEFLFRFSPLYFPIMHKITMRADYFYVPTRIVWPYVSEANKGWTRWISEQEDTVDLEIPVMDAEMKWDSAGFNIQVLAYMGIPLIPPAPVPTDSSTVITELLAFPLSAYLKIWDEYYRNTQLEDERWFPLEPGDNTAAFDTAFSVATTKRYNCFSSKWEMDYFTSALPQPQLGEAIAIPQLTTDRPLEPTTALDADGNPITINDYLKTAGGDGHVEVDNAGGPATLDNTANAASIRQLRQAEALQTYRERLMKIGQRYRDWVKGIFGRDPQPGQIDIPVLIGSKFGRVQIADVMTQALTNQTSPAGKSQTGDYTGQANMYSSDGGTMKYYCPEHGYIIVTLQLNANTSYGQGIHRFWRRKVQQDFPNDWFAKIGDQEILKEEVMYNAYVGEEELNLETFGYIERFAEMRYMNNLHVGNLNIESLGLTQHLGRWWRPQDTHGAQYQSLIQIGTNFLGAKQSSGFFRESDVFRILPDENYAQQVSEGTIYAHIFHSLYVNRALPVHSIPGL